MRNNIKRLLGLALASVILITSFPIISYAVPSTTSTSIPGQQQYQVISIETPGFQPKFILDAETPGSPGRVVVQQNLAVGAQCGSIPAIWDISGNAQVLRYPPNYCGFKACAATVGDSGPIILGYAIGASPKRLLLWKNDTYTTLPANFDLPLYAFCEDGPPWVKASKILNRSGHVLGRITSANDTPAVWLNGDIVIPINGSGPNGNPIVVQQANSINDSRGVILKGIYQRETISGLGLFNGGGNFRTEIIPSLRPGYDFYPFFHNNLNTVIGDASSGRFTVWKAGAGHTIIELQGWRYNEAIDLNDSDKIIGNGSLASDYSTGSFIYDFPTRKVTQLNKVLLNNTLLPIPGSIPLQYRWRFVLNNVTRINTNPGSILASGSIEGRAANTLLVPRYFGSTSTTIPPM